MAERRNETEEPDHDNLRASATITLASNTQMITAALAILALIGALLTYTLDKRDPQPGFYVIVVLSFVLLLFSGVCGGFAIDQLAANVSAGVFNGRRRRFLHQAQTILLFAGIGMLLIAFYFFGPSKEDRVDRLQNRVSELETTQRALVDQIQYQKDDLQKHESEDFVP